MAKAFTYSRLPEHQVSVYYDGNDKTGRCIFEDCRASMGSCNRVSRRPSQFLPLLFRQTIRVECSGMFVFILLLFASAFHVSNFSFLLRKGKLRVLFL